MGKFYRCKPLKLALRLRPSKAGAQARSTRACCGGSWGHIRRRDTIPSGWTRPALRGANTAHEDAPRDHNARRPAPRDAVAVAELRALSAPRAVGLRCRRHPLGRAASSDVLRQRARAQCLLELLPHSVSIIWVEPLPYSFVAWKALQRIKCLNSVTLVRRIDILPRCRVEDQGTRVAQPLCFRQIAFAAA
jgi:hypothetical protein